jgi:ATP-dependent Clp protease protease subunit
MRRLMEVTISRHTGKPEEQVRKDTDRDKILTAEEAKEYGIIDQVFDYRKLSGQK